jgi:hypothetical protein
MTVLDVPMTMPSFLIVASIVWASIRLSVMELKSGEPVTGLSWPSYLAVNSTWIGAPVELLSCLYRHRFPDQHKDELTALCTRLFEAEALRNRITHSTWGAGGEPGYTTRMKITAKQKGFSFQVEKMSREDITAIADGIAVIATEVLTFIIKFIFNWDLGDTEAATGSAKPPDPAPQSA